MKTDGQKLVEFLDKIFVNPTINEFYNRIFTETAEAFHSPFTESVPQENLTFEKINEACAKILEINNPQYPLLGIKIIESPYAVTKSQFRFPKTKKKRILKKWSKRDRNFKDMPCMYAFSGNLVCHPAIDFKKCFTVRGIKE